MSSITRRKPSDEDKKQSRRQISKVLENFLKLKLETADNYNHAAVSRSSVNSSVGGGIRRTEIREVSASMPSVYPPRISASVEVIGYRNSSSNTTTARERSSSASKRESSGSASKRESSGSASKRERSGSAPKRERSGSASRRERSGSGTSSRRKSKLTLNWKKVKKLSALINRTDSKVDQPQSPTGQAIVQKNEISESWRNGDRSNFYQYGISAEDDTEPTAGISTEETKKSEGNGITAVPAELTRSKWSMLRQVSRDSSCNSERGSPVEGSEEDKKMMYVAQWLAALSERNDLRLADMGLGNCSYTTKKKTYKRFQKMASEAIRKTSNAEVVGSPELSSPQQMAQIATVLDLSGSIISAWGNIGDLADKVKKHTKKFIHDTFTEWIIMQGGWGSFDPAVDD
ncbi:uncharacterized protein TRIADDRAFT_63781 [Trichoplax adhaerens]|uniref:Uncharacterized protein n=1 Tax=Trichoplax adhaerens TaxID=10228 RepID=B3RSY3_TRIAD|nr:predicted protein [Trichoplax adhaerens]EDV27128.1 predicted protein [Trichoplax adhaerens]|eukprot:XP_002111124.1 predicted protein [Trichoplax adhaerens]